MIELQSHIVGEIYREGSVYQGLQSNSTVQDIYNRNKTQEFKALNASIAGFGLGVGTSISQQSVIPEASLFDETCKLVEIIRHNTKQENPVIIQVNNLDINAVFYEDGLIGFLNCIRDTLQIKGINFILIGTEGINSLVKSKIRRLSQILSTTIFVDAFSFEELLQVFDKRIKNELS